ncbi:hypothetical protein EXIGLDRAFT_777230 [Exidia glandulosa HHB12029]|uniref:SnoaL-like domain-containing protein n=1 Tax=Exidia glandulosa HHB12029 TaxID=1314781 RepID=A0A165ZLI1_EXIGL|nr:hypothetical protein EXIGLDRAFT_777230 [Exidia glandulosa HHB12029]
MATAIQAALQVFIDAYARGDITPLCTLFAPEFEIELLPKSMNVVPRNKEEYLSWIRGVLSTFRDGQLEVVELIEAPDSRKGTVHTRSYDTALANGTPHMEYIWIITFDETLNKIVHVKEFFDSGLHVRLREQGLVVQD